VSDRPTELDIALDAIDDDFKAAIAQFAKTFAINNDAAALRDGYERVRRSRADAIALVQALAAMKQL
jgi:hypothetical protein